MALPGLTGKDSMRMYLRVSPINECTNWMKHRKLRLGIHFIRERLTHTGSTVGMAVPA